MCSLHTGLTRSEPFRMTLILGRNGGGSLVKLVKGPVKQNRIPVVYSSSGVGYDAAASRS